MNLGKSGASLSFGGRGFHYTVGSKGTRTTIGLPGTGLSWTAYTPYGQSAHAPLQPYADSVDGESLQAPGLDAIESAPLERIGARSTSDIAPLLAAAHRRIRLTIPVMILAAGQLVLSNRFGNPIATAVSLAYFLIFLVLAIWLDRYRRSIKVQYDLSGLALEISDTLGRAFSRLAASTSAWIVFSEGHSDDWKRNAGATRLNTRKKSALTFRRPPYIRTRIKFPSVAISGVRVFFLPDAALVLDSRSVTALRYRDLDASVSQVQFIEEGAVPRDTSVVSYTWRFVNKKGGPDQRFNNNRQLPVCLYGEMDFSSIGGLNGRIQFSDPNAGNDFVTVLDALRDPRLQTVTVSTVGSFRTPRRWPTVLFVFCFLALGAALLGAMIATGGKLRPASTTTLTEPHKPPIKQQLDQSQQSLAKSRPQSPAPLVIAPQIPPRRVTPLPRPKPTTR